jgi:5-methylthioadenosine/S-adenosylhomocysteine deaminase
MSTSIGSVPAACDLLIHEASIVTPGESLQRNTSIAVKGRRIAAMGTRDSFSSCAAERTIEARGGLVIPGMTNTHNHTPLMVVRGMVEDLGFAPAYTAGVPQGHWLGDEETYLLARLGLAELLMQGCTHVVDFYARPQALARAMVESGLRGDVGGRIMDVDTAELANGRSRTLPQLGATTLADNLELISEYDGAADGRIRCVLGPHAPDTCSPGLLRQVADIANEQQRFVHTHLAQSAIEVQRVRERDGRRPCETLEEAGLLGPRTVAAHCIHLHSEDISRLVDTGTVIAHAPAGNATGGAIAPIVDLAEAGARITLCTDSKSADMFETMRTAIRVARIRADGEFKLDASTVFAWATSSGAEALGHAAQLGRIAPGYLADLVLLDARAPNLRPVVDGVGILVHSGNGANVKTVICDGKVVVDDGVPTCFDLDEVITAAQAVSDRLWKKARNHA